MESLLENKPMLYSLLFSGCAVFTLASGVSPELSERFELVELPFAVSLVFEHLGRSECHVFFKLQKDSQKLML